MQVLVRNLEDPRLAVYRDLKTPRRELARDYFVVEGHLLTERLLRSPFSVASVLVTEAWRERAEALVPGEIPTYVVPTEAVSDLVGFRFHRGILACGCRHREVGDWKELLPRTPLRLVVCPELQDPENLGTILRASAAFGMTGVLLGSACPDPLSRRVLRVSMGASLHLPIHRFEETETLVQQLGQQGVSTWATVLDAKATPIRHLPRPEKIALILGREDRGLPQAVIALSTERVTIPMHPGTDSLNVAMAATLFLYELALASQAFFPGSRPPGE